MTAEGKARKWAFGLLAVAIAWQFYPVQELLAAFAFFAIGFGALAFVVLSLYALQKGWEIAVVRIFDGKRWMARGVPSGVFCRAGRDLAGSQPAQELKTGNRNSKDSRRATAVNWGAGQNCVDRV